MRNVAHKRFTENQNTHFVFSNLLFVSKIVLRMRKCGKIW